MKDSDGRQRRYLQIFWGLFILPFALLTLIFSLIITGHMGFMPTFRDLENPESNLASEVITSDGQILGKFYYENRSFINFDELSPDVEKALMATEDIRFKRHSGIDPRGLVRVLFRTILLGDKEGGGGSTITQQLAKNLFPRDTATYSWVVPRKWSLVKSKFKEWVIAVRLERNYTKREIMVMYLNTVPFGQQAFGLRSASKIYFSSDPDSLKLEEAAMLVGMLKAPTRYSPISNPDRALVRRNVVLGQMRKYGFLSEEMYDSISNLPLELKLNIEGHNEGYGTYFREYIRRTMNAKPPERSKFKNYASYQADSAEWANNPLYGWCSKNRKPDGEPYDLYRDGLKIYSTIDYRMQEHAEAAVREHLGGYLQQAFNEEKKGRKYAPFSIDLTSKEIESIMTTAMMRTDRYRDLRRAGVSSDSIYKAFHTAIHMKVFTWQGERDTVMTPWDSIRFYKFYLQAGLLSLNPVTGDVKAYVGGIDFRHFKYDHVMSGKRQVGSTIKPFFYTLAMMEGLTPCTPVLNSPVSFILGDSIYTPRNSGKTRYDNKMVTLKWGLENSVNTIAAWLVKRFNPESVIAIMRKMGVKSPIDPVPSMVYGTSDISVYEMTGAYATYPNKGVYITPNFVYRIEDKNGNVISQFKPQMVEAIDENTAYLMVEMLKGVTKYGSAARLRYRYNFTNEIGGKTGTTQEQSDGWFCGFTPELVTAVWVGGEERSIHFDKISMGQGANMALPIWAYYMKGVMEDPKIGYVPGTFERPAGFSVDLNCGDMTEPDGGEEIIE
jgi:penicillin-binding protein 1A